MKDHIFELWRKIRSYDRSSQLYTTSLYRTKPRYSEHIPPVPWLFVISRFHSWLTQNYGYILQWNLLMGNKEQKAKIIKIAICLAFSWSPGVWVHFFWESKRSRDFGEIHFRFCILLSRRTEEVVRRLIVLKKPNCCRKLF